MAKKKDVTKTDGWQNVLTGLNMMGRDKKMSTVAEYSRMSQGDAEFIFAADKLAKKIVNYPVTECFRKAPTFSNGGEDEATFSEDMRDKILKPYGFQEKFVKAAQWARLYGAGFLLFGVRDGRLPNEPVDYNNIRSVDWIQPIHRWELGYQEIERDVSQPYYREPVVYTLNEAGASSDETVGFSIHRSRLIRIDGETLPDELYKINGYYHDSVLNALQNALRNFSASHDSAASLLDDFAQAVFKIQGLAGLIAAGKDDQVIKRLQLIDTTRSVVRGIVLDSEEDFDRKVTTLTGLDQILDKMGDKLVADSEFPHTILLGEGSTGSLSGAGESESRQWYEFLKNLQNNTYKKPYLDGLKLLTSAKNSPIKWSEALDMDFPQLEELSDEKQASVNKMQAEADQIYIQNQVVTPDEVAVSRFGEDKHSLKTHIDVEARQELLDADKEIDVANATADITAALGNSTSEEVQKTALNGAQVSSMVEVVLNFRQNLLDRNGAKAMLMTAYDVDDATAEAILGDDAKIETPAMNPTQVNDEAGHFHDFQGEASGAAIDDGNGGHYHEVMIEGETIRTDTALNSAYHTHTVEDIEKTGVSVEIRVDEDGLSAKDRTPPEGAINAAKKVLEWQKEHKDEIQGMTSVGWARARQIASGSPLSLKTIKAMAQFARHEKNAKLKDENKSTPWKDAGRVAWMGWGDDAGIKWAKRISEKAKK